MEMSVVDCAEDRNADICREYEIFMYPNCKFFWINSKALRDYTKPAPADADTDSKVTHSPNEVGLNYDGELNNIAALRKGLIDFLEKSWSKGTPREWPDIHQVSALNKEQFFKQLPVLKQLPTMVVIEKSDSYIGREVILVCVNLNLVLISFVYQIILDMSLYQSKVTVLRVHDLNKALINELLPHPLETYKLPLLLEVHHANQLIEVLCW